MIFGPTDENVSSAWVFTMAEAGSAYDDILVLMESSGLLDKNGKEIFEGDIVKDGWGDDIGQVEFSYGCFSLGFGYIDALSIQAGDSEVIGNIYENPDLLKP